MAIRGIISWENPTQYTDGTAYNAAEDNAGYDVAIDSEEPQLALPFAFGTSYDLNTWELYQNLSAGPHVVRLRVVSRHGEVSEWASVPFRKAGTVRAPSALSVE